MAQQPAPEAASSPAPARRATTPTTPVTIPGESALPGVTSGEIRAELARRQRRVPKLMAERAQVLQQMEAIAAVLESIGEEVPEANAAVASCAP